MARLRWYYLKPMAETLLPIPADCYPVVPFSKNEDRLVLLDFTSANKDLTATIIQDTGLFSAYVSRKIKKAGARYGIGGYDEHRTVYSRSKVFDDPVAGEEPRRLHLGVDIWGEAGTPVYAPIDGIVHSFAFNNRSGDYGATIIVSHEVNGIRFHSLYGHLSLADLQDVQEGENIAAGQLLAHFGEAAENGHWPPHLHFQLIMDMEGKKGDYPGVCKFSDRERYLLNCPNPDLLLRMMPYAMNTDSIL